eukprot:4288594-Pyramimonas_sp.AAC.1
MRIAPPSTITALALARLEQVAMEEWDEKHGLPGVPRPSSGTSTRPLPPEGSALLPEAKRRNRELPVRRLLRTRCTMAKRRDIHTRLSSMRQ